MKYTIAFLFAALSTYGSELDSLQIGQITPELRGPRFLHANEVMAMLYKHGGVILSDLTVRGILEIPYETKVDNLDVTNVVFTDGIHVSGPKGGFRFSRTQFNGGADFYLGKFRELSFDECVFNESANFHSVETPSLWCTGTKFMKDVVFVAAKIGDLNLADAQFEKSVDFGGATLDEANLTRVRSSQPIQLSWSQFGDRWFQESISWATAPLLFSSDERDSYSRLRQVETALLFWKRNFLALGLQRDALEANLKIVELRRSYFLKPSQLEWWLSFPLGLPNAYGTKPFRPLWIATLFVVLFGMIYWLKDPFTEVKDGVHFSRRPRLLFCLMYSLDTFIPLIEITGVKQWGWGISERFKWVETLERIMGLTISAVAAYSIGSYGI